MYLKLPDVNGSGNEGENGGGGAKGGMAGAETSDWPTKLIIGMSVGCSGGALSRAFHSWGFRST